MNELYTVRAFDGRAALHFGPFERVEANDLRDAIKAANPSLSVSVRRLLAKETAVRAGENLGLLLEAVDA